MERTLAIAPTETQDFTPQDMALAEALWLDNAAKNQVENLVCLMERVRRRQIFSVDELEPIILEAAEFIHGIWAANDLYLETVLAS
jgi:hypothetical protein